jgi:hypothetical protein
MVEARRITTTADLNFESRIVRMAPERSTSPIVKPSASYTSVVPAKYESGGAVQTVLSSMPIEAAAVDAFVQDLHAVGQNRAGTAYLKRSEGPAVIPASYFVGSLVLVRR